MKSKKWNMHIDNYVIYNHSETGIYETDVLIRSYTLSQSKEQEGLFNKSWRIGELKPQKKIQRNKSHVIFLVVCPKNNPTPFLV